MRARSLRGDGRGLRSGCRSRAAGAQRLVAAGRGVCLGPSSRCRTTHVVDSLPERVRLVEAPGELRNVELEVLGWTSEAGETVLICRLVDGSTGTIPARWTDLPWRAQPELAVGGLGSPAGWRLLLARAERVRARRPGRGRASSENGGDDVGTARACDERGGTGGSGGMGGAAVRAPGGVDAQARAAAGAADGGRAR